MSFTFYEASAPVFVNALSVVPNWLDKALSEGKSETDILEARLAADMRPLTAQIQMASDSAKNGIARLAGLELPSMPDTEATVAELKARCRKTVDYIMGVDPALIEAGAEREIELRFPNGKGYRWNGRDYLTGFAVPNFFFHITTTYALLRAMGVTVGKPDFLAYLGAPIDIA